jgi:uncharacterized protein YhbP (UPF0306 family)
MMNTSQTARYLIENNKHMTVATASTDAKPWVSPVFYTPDKAFNLYWVSDKEAIHSRNIRSNPRVAIVIFGPVPPDNTIDGVYLDADAVELADEQEIQAAIGVLTQRKQAEKFTIKSPSDVTGRAAWRIYKATPKQVSKRADAVNEASGQAITVRESVDLSASAAIA